MKGKRILALALAAALLTGCSIRPHTSGGRPPETGETVGTTEDDMGRENYIRSYMREMTLREKVGQLFFIRPDSLDPGQTQAEINGWCDHPVRSVTEEIRATLRAYPVGGVAIFGKNIVSPEQLTELNAALQAASRTPLFLSVDEEGGAVARLANSAAFALPRYESAAAVGSTGDPARAEEMGRTIGAYLRQYGFNMDFAPVADVVTDGEAPSSGTGLFPPTAPKPPKWPGPWPGDCGRRGSFPSTSIFPATGTPGETAIRGPRWRT